jgi:hypothetical protein
MEELSNKVKLKEDLARNMAYSIYEYIKKEHYNDQFNVFLAKKNAVDYSIKLLRKEISFDDILSEIDGAKNSYTKEFEWQ